MFCYLLYECDDDDEMITNKISQIYDSIIETVALHSSAT